MCVTLVDRSLWFDALYHSLAPRYGFRRVARSILRAIRLLPPIRPMSRPPTRRRMRAPRSLTATRRQESRPPLHSHRCPLLSFAESSSPQSFYPCGEQTYLSLVGAGSAIHCNCPFLAAALRTSSPSASVAASQFRVQPHHAHAIAALIFCIASDPSLRRVNICQRSTRDSRFRSCVRVRFRSCWSPPTTATSSVGIILIWPAQCLARFALKRSAARL